MVSKAEALQIIEELEEKMPKPGKEMPKEMPKPFTNEKVIIKILSYKMKLTFVYRHETQGCVTGLP